MKKWKCGACGKVVKEDEFITGPDPRGGVMLGCPHCFNNQEDKFTKILEENNERTSD